MTTSERQELVREARKLVAPYLSNEYKGPDTTRVLLALANELEASVPRDAVEWLWDEFKKARENHWGVIYPGQVEAELDKLLAPQDAPRDVKA